MGLGANLGDAAATLAAGVHALAALPAARLVGVSRLYATAPVGVADQPEFRNAVAALRRAGRPGPGDRRPGSAPRPQGLERAFGRRARERWGREKLDLDLLVFGRHAVHVERPPAARSDDPAKPAVQWLGPPMPAPGAPLRARPLADLAPGLRPPGWGETVTTARARAANREGPDAVRPIARWDARAGAGPRLPDYSRTAGGRLRSNMWTVSTKRTCLVW